jgi:hypothetical protein
MTVEGLVAYREFFQAVGFPPN